MLKKNPLALVLGLSAFFFVVFVAVAVGTVMTLTPGRAQKRFFSKGNAIGILDVKGVITDSKKLLEQIDMFSEDQGIKGVVVRINSPGGAVAPSQEIYDGLQKLGKKKPVYASMSSLAASGGYYVACGTKKIFANAGTITGSIGVIMEFADLSKLFQWAKVNPYNVKTGKFKDIGSPSREMTEDEKALLQGMVDNVLGQFRKTVASARNLPLERVVELSDGRIFSGEQARDVKLVDEIGGFNDTIDALAKEVGIVGKPRLVYATKHKRPFEWILGDADDDEDAESSSTSGRIGRLVSALGLLADGVRGAAQVLPAVSKTAGPMFLLPSFVAE